MLAYLKLEVTRTLRNRRFLIFVIAFPIGFYLLFTHIFNSNLSAADKAEFFRTYMVSMAAYGAVGTALMTTGPRIALERASGWNQQLRLTPLTPAAALVGKILTAVATALLAPVVVTVIARVVNGVSLPVGNWLALVAVLWIGTIPFAALGVAFGYLLDGETAQIATMIVYFVLAILGGFWAPIDQFPAGLRRVGKALPTFRYGNLGWSVVDGHTPKLVDVLVLGGYGVAFTLLGILAYRRPAMRTG